MPAGRRARLTLSRIDPWSVLKFSVLLYVCVYLIFMVAGVMLWTAGTITGLRDNVESFVGDLLSSPRFTFVGSQILQASAVGGAAMVVVGSGVNVLMAVLYNLITDVVGGIGVTLQEQRPKQRPVPKNDRVEPEHEVAPPVPATEEEPASPEPVKAQTGDRS